ncbi:Yip1 family protein [Planococcus sp. ISL-109]|uniref:Yip1 family protein n=1 Tax=Planococcus sp. ISL-109 TaxID=2819166 RepID=UPI001BEB8CE2|nr:Yip1 family protein [Planococcus sp. ISL-109]MBT2583346.1 YIP1 family protein [Planococcus sp. ISL-109]
MVREERLRKEREVNPFTDIWLRTRETVRFVIERKSVKYIILLIVLTGFASGLLGFMNTRSADMAPWAAVLQALVTGPIGSAFGYFLGAAILTLVGRLFKGTATYQEMFKGLVTAQIPQIWLLPLLIIWAFASPATFFADRTDVEGNLLVVIMSVVMAVVSVWTFIIVCKAVGEAHRVSTWKGFFIVVIPGILITIVVVLIVFVIFASFFSQFY